MKRSEKRQFLASMCCNILTFSMGMGGAWATTSFIELQEKSLIPTGRLTSEEAGLVVALPNAGTLVANILFLYVCEKYGQRDPLLYLAFPQMISWVLIYYAQNVYYLYVSRVLTGFALGGMCVCSNIFTMEISDPKFRGTLNSLFILTVNSGTLVGFIVAKYIEYKLQAIVNFFIPLIYFILFSFIPDSPRHLLKVNKVKLAEKSTKFYGNTEKVPEKDEFLSNEKPNDDIEEIKSPLAIRDFFKPAARRALFITIVLMTVSQLSGLFILVSYSTTVFIEAGSNLSAIESSMVIIVVQIIGNFIIIGLVDRIGRKLLYLASAIAVTLTMIGLGCCSLYKNELGENLKWAPVASFALLMFAGEMGFLPLPFLIIIEIIPEKIRNVTMPSLMCFMCVLGFGSNYCYPILQKSVGMHGCCFIFAGVCFIGFLFGLLMVPETRGRSYGSIMRLLEK